MSGFDLSGLLLCLNSHIVILFLMFNNFNAGKTFNSFQFLHKSLIIFEQRRKGKQAKIEINLPSRIPFSAWHNQTITSCFVHRLLTILKDDDEEEEDDRNAKKMYTYFLFMLFLYLYFCTIWPVILFHLMFPRNSFPFFSKSSVEHSSHQFIQAVVLFSFFYFPDKWLFGTEGLPLSPSYLLFHPDKKSLSLLTLY